MNAIHWVVLALLAFGATMLVGSSLTLGVGCGLVAALAFAIYTSREVKTSLVATRQTDGTLVEVGSSVSVRVRVEAGGAFALRWLLVKDTLPLGVATDAPTGKLVIGGSGLQADFLYRVAFPLRGVYRLGPIEASHGDILYLRTATERLEGTDEVVVHPKIQLMTSFSLGSARPLGDRRADRRANEDPTRPAGCRPYAYGDPIKRIHWAAYARSGTLVSKVYDASSQPIHVVVLNCCRADYSSAERFELACTAAASMVAALCREGEDIGLVASSYVKPDTGEVHLERCLEGIARANLGDDPLCDVLLRSRPQLPWRATLVLATEGLDELASATLDVMHQAGYTVAALVVGDAIESQRPIGRIAALGGSVARILQEEDIVTAHFVGTRR